MAYNPSQMHLIDGWHVANESGVLTYTAQFYSEAGTAPNRGMSLRYLGQWPGSLSYFVVSQVAITPLSSRGPYLIDITAVPPSAFQLGDGVSRLNSRNASKSVRQYKVRKHQLEDWPQVFRDRGLKRSASYAFDFVTADYYVIASRFSQAGGGIVNGIPGWCGLGGHGARQWRLFSLRQTLEFDNDGTTPLKHNVVELIGVPGSLGTSWDYGYYGTVGFDSL